MSEKRAATLGAETREDGGLVLRGYAALYNTEAVIAGMFREKIAPGAFDEAVGRDDVRALFNHDNNIVLGRTSSGDLRLTTDDRGLAYEIDIDPQDAEAVRVYRMVQKGKVSQSSFGFDIPSGGQEWSEAARGEMPLRIIRKARLFDVSPVTYPAYAETSVTARDLPTAAADAAQVLAEAQAAGYARARARRLALVAREAV